MAKAVTWMDWDVNVTTSNSRTFCFLRWEDAKILQEGNQGHVSIEEKRNFDDSAF